MIQIIQALQKTIPGLPMAEKFGIARSCAIYFGQPWKWNRLESFYGKLFKPGDLCFDIGAHVGNRAFFWRRLGVEVVAVEPIQYLYLFLSELFKNESQVSIVNCAVGAKNGISSIMIDPRNPTVSSISHEWRERLKSDPGWDHVRWQRRQNVKVRSLDDLIAEYGEPQFCKIDVEGFELEVLKGLSRPLKCLSFEIIPSIADQAIDCVRMLESLGTYEYCFSTGESLKFDFTPWIDAENIICFINGLAPNAPSGDLIARIVV